MRPVVLPLILGLALWSFAGWAAFPREIWDVPAFWWVWGAATALAGGMGYAWARRPALPPVLMFAPLAAVLIVSGLMTGGGFGLLPLGLVLVAILSVPALGLSFLAARLNPSRV